MILWTFTTETEMTHKFSLAAALVWLLAAFSTAAVAADETDAFADEDALLARASEPWVGDLDGMVERGFVRVLTTHNPLFFHYDGNQLRGIVFELTTAFQERLRKTQRRAGPPLDVMLIPVRRDELFTKLLDGRGDIAVANLTITPDREKLVDFSIPFYADVRELVVTGPAAPEIASFDDLATSEVYVRRSSSYFEHLSALNATRRKESKKAIPVREADERLEDYDLLDLVNAGIIPAVVVDSHKAALWAQVFDDIRVHDDLAVNTGGSIAWAVRKDSPHLKAAVDDFVTTAAKGTAFGNVLIKRYLRSAKWMENALAAGERRKLSETVDFIKRHADTYGFDWLMVAAQGYQESTLDQRKRSPVGAVGIMQLMPTTANDPNVGIPDIHLADRNVEAGVKYLRFLRERYFDDPKIAPFDRALFSFAAYNAGPGNIAKARRKAAAMNLDPNVWFDNVEIAAGRVISREPVVYVRNVFKYYTAFKLFHEAGKEREAARETGR
ncbi:MAG: transglycosylase SLT domain-containing protein [Rhodospirillales bacterium]